MHPSRIGHLIRLPYELSMRGRGRQGPHYDYCCGGVVSKAHEQKKKPSPVHSHPPRDRHAIRTLMKSRAASSLARSFRKKCAPFTRHLCLVSDRGILQERHHTAHCWSAGRVARSRVLGMDICISIVSQLSELFWQLELSHNCQRLFGEDLLLV